MKLINRNKMTYRLFVVFLLMFTHTLSASEDTCLTGEDCPDQPSCSANEEGCEKAPKVSRQRGAMSDHDSVIGMPFSIETSYSLPENGERMLPADTFIFWGLPDAAELISDNHEVTYKINTTQETITHKIGDEVDDIRFRSGDSVVPDRYVATLEELLISLKARKNVRLHFIGHTDNEKLSARARAKYIDNQGLSIDRAKKVAMHFKNALSLKIEAVSWDGKGDTQPLQSNDTQEGMIQNRRVEIEVWYDEVVTHEEKVEIAKEEPDMLRTRVCHVQTMCREYTEINEYEKVQIKNVVDPIRFEIGDSLISSEYVDKFSTILSALKDKKNLQLVFVGHTDNQKLGSHLVKIYEDNEGLSKARAKRVAEHFRQELNLPVNAVDSLGKGFSEPIASNANSRGRTLNRRVEVLVRYDKLSGTGKSALGELQQCPAERKLETVEEEKYWAAIKFAEPVEPVRFESGKHNIPDEYIEQIRVLLSKLSDKEHLRLHFIGHTDSDKLSRRSANKYLDNHGLSMLRARQVMELVQKKLQLSDEAVSFDGKGYTQPLAANSSEEGKRLNRRVELEVWYDEPRQRNVAVKKAFDEIKVNGDPRDAFSLSPFRITLDGKPIDDAESVHTADVQRCVDVALEKAQIQLQYDNLSIKPSLNINAWPSVITYNDDAETTPVENITTFTGYTNYSAYFERGEVRLFMPGQSLKGQPMYIVALDDELNAQWQFDASAFDDLPSEFTYVLRVYDKDNVFDETKPQRLWLRNELSESSSAYNVEAEKRIGYGENSLATQNITIASGTITVNGKDVPQGHKIYVMGKEVPLDDSGRFVTRRIIPDGYHTIEVAVLDENGNGELFHRDLQFAENDWFYVGIADVTIGAQNTNGSSSIVTQHNGFDDSYIDGRLAYYVKGKTESDWEITSSADTREEPLGDLFNNFADKDPLMLFRRLDSDLYYPTFADDSTLEEDAPTQGKFYFKAKKRKSFGLWGNFESKILDTDLAQIDRALYGAQLHYESSGADGITYYGEQKTQIDAFAAEAGTQSAREEYRGTGGSLYFLKHQDISIGSERIRLEMRDKDTGIVVKRQSLVAGQDYEIDFLQGRVILNAPLSASGSDGLLVRDTSVAGNDNYLIVSYEFTPGFDDVDDLSMGGRASQWLGDHVKLGITASEQELNQVDQKLHALDLTLRLNPTNYLKFEVAQTEGLASQQRESIDGGFTFSHLQQQGTLALDQRADAARVEAGFQLGKKGRASAFVQSREAGFSAPGQLTTTDTLQFGAQGRYALTKDVSVNAKYSQKDEDLGEQNKALDASVGIDLDKQWTLDAGARFDEIQNNLLSGSINDQGKRTDLTAELGYNSLERWTTYGFAQGTVQRESSRDKNHRAGLGGSYQVLDRLTVDAEVSSGSSGEAAKVGTDFQATDRSQLYMAYALENNRNDTGIRSQRGNITGGFKSRFTDDASVYAEERYAYGDQPVGLTHAYGVDLSPLDTLNLGASMEAGKLRSPAGGSVSRFALGMSAGYAFEEIKFAGSAEYRRDDTDNNNRVTWLLRNKLSYQQTDDWRMLAKLNWAQSESSQGEFFDGDFTEMVFGYGYRPVDNNAINALFKYTYFFNKPAPEQVSTQNTNSNFIQRSHILSADVDYHLNSRWTLGGKYAYKMGELAADRVDPDYFKSRAHLLVLRADWHVVRHWDFLVEGRTLNLVDAKDTRSGFLAGIYRHVGNHLKLGVGYNFTDFSDDLTDLDFDSHGVFINIVGKI